VTRRKAKLRGSRTRIQAGRAWEVFVRIRSLIASLAAASAFTAFALPAAAALPPLIPRDVLFGLPERTGAQLSPDGKRLSYLAPSNGVMAVWVRTIGASDDRVVASDPKRPIRNAFWSPDGSRVLFLQDAAGDENFHLFAVDPAAPAAPVDLTPYPKTRVGVESIDYARPTILITMNKRDPKLFDVYRLDPRTGETVLDTQNPGNAGGFQEDTHDVVRAAVVQNADASNDVLVRDAAGAPWRKFVTFSADDGPPDVPGFTTDGKGLYVITAAGVNAAHLFRYDLATGARTDILSDPQYDVAGVAFSPKTKAPIAAAIVRDRADFTVLDPAYAADLDAVKRQIPGDITIQSTDRDERVWLIASTVDVGGTSYWSYDRSTKTATKLFDTRPALANYTLAPMRPVTYAARDGLTIHGYLTLPVGVEPKNLPTVVFVHGGPWARDVWSYNSYAQWLANRGYAVLMPNFRGSTGFGKAFVNAGDRQWAGSMRTDLLDGKAWLVNQGISDPKRIAIMGGSYGGYATLAALAFSPNEFAAGVDIVGPSNLNTLLQSIPPYWETIRSTFARRMGDTPDVLTAQSPLFKADAIRVPLLIGQGLNDPRVNVRESDQIVAAMRKNGKPVTYVVFPDEGHGFARPENNKRFNAAVETFLAKNLGGRAEPARADESVEAYLK
jgi:dipeptidyl aminopeptidase/acylaminoacyl peptidase